MLLPLAIIAGTFIANFFFDVNIMLLVIIDGILNIVFGDPFFSMPGVSTMVVDAVIVVWCAWSGYRNVMNGGTWYAPKK